MNSQKYNQADSQSYTGAIEAGGTKFVCAIIDQQRNVLESARIPTAHPFETLIAVVNFFTNMMLKGYKVDCIGLASFGPLDLDVSSKTYGALTSTPKPGWQNIAMPNGISCKDIIVHPGLGTQSGLMGAYALTLV
ncbi:MAG: fructokinase [Alphaproteobacteria bacterium]|jgi:fructokinase